MDDLGAILRATQPGGRVPAQSRGQARYAHRRRDALDRRSARGARAESRRKSTAAKSGAISTGCPTRTSRRSPVSARSNIAAALVGVFDSQVTGGKRYDLATAGRRLAHATYYASHGTDQESALSFAMDLTPLVEDPALVDPGLRAGIYRPLPRGCGAAVEARCLRAGRPALLFQPRQICRAVQSRLVAQGRLLHPRLGFRRAIGERPLLRASASSAGAN